MPKPIYSHEHKEKLTYDYALKKGLSNRVNHARLVTYMGKHKDFKYAKLLPSLNTLDTHKKDILLYELFYVYQHEDSLFGLEKFAEYFEKNYTFSKDIHYHVNLMNILLNRFETVLKELEKNHGFTMKYFEEEKEALIYQEKIGEIFDKFEQCLEVLLHHDFQLTSPEVICQFMMRKKYISSWQWLFTPSLSVESLLSIHTPQGNILHDYCAWLAQEVKNNTFPVIMDEFGYYANFGHKVWSSVFMQARSHGSYHTLSQTKKTGNQVFVAEKPEFSNKYLTHLNKILDLLCSNTLCYDKMREVNHEGKTPEDYFFSEDIQLLKDMQMLYLKKQLELSNIDKRDVNRRRSIKI